MNPEAQYGLRRLVFSGGDLAKIQDALAAGADVNHVDSQGYTPLMFAVGRKHEATVAALIECGADINPPNPKLNPLALARRLRLHDMAEFLVSKGARCETWPEPGTAEKDLRLAARTGKLPLLEQALADGADINFCFDGRLTALAHAICRDRKEMVEALLAAGASPDVKDEGGENIILVVLEEIREMSHYRRMRTALKKRVPHIFEAKQS